MNSSEPVPSGKTVYLKDYAPPSYIIEKTELDVDIYKGETFVLARLQFQCLDERPQALTLDGEALELLDIAIDGKALDSTQYRCDHRGLTLHNPPERFVLTTRVRILPEQNTSLEGLYRSRTIYCTQCEAEGFRKITYYLDRPDVMSDFITRVSADKNECPILLSNGNKIDGGDLDGGRHFATWHDPHKKPCYLFALVAGDLAKVEDRFRTASGREVTLQIFVEEKDLDKCDHAMSSLKNAMRWDEQVYGREYDLDIFMIVAVDDFNMGAMENKGLNIFNTSCVLAKPETTTDAGFQRVEGVVAHEYFHNWSGNRVTCRDWFQLSLKEGFTVFRDAEFSADMGSRTVKRVEDVAVLRTLQFAEDAGPMAHPIRPASYMEISNFYTLTIYEKGAEVVRMLANLLGPADFRKATDLYFERHDGQAVTTEEFVQAMEDASGRDLTQFKRWYNQAGTPRLSVTDEYDQEQRRYSLTIRQSTPATPECAEKLAFHIPVAMGLLGEAGELALKLADESLDDLPEDNTHRVLELTETEQTFVFTDIPEKPVPSLLRGFSAPVKLDYQYSRADLATLALHDSDGFNRYEACQKLALATIQDAMLAYQQDTLAEFVPDSTLVQVYRLLLEDNSLDQAMLALMLNLPSEAYIAEEQEVIDPVAIHFARRQVAAYVGSELAELFRLRVSAYDPTREYRAQSDDIALRSMKNAALGYLMLLPTAEDLHLCLNQLARANNMTDEMAALTALVCCEDNTAQEQARDALTAFYQKWQDEPLVVNQWLALQARNPIPGALERVQALLQHPAYDGNNPNKIRSVISVFCNNNPLNFHTGTADEPDAGYRFLAEQILQLDSKNPQIAARLITPLTRWRRYTGDRGQAMRLQLQRLADQPGLSPDSYEIVSKSLN
ncbi:aminopeptidase N [Gilvimarinus algae]|uniref:Aminopeptidase N n=1 Tax=Gilvimarinus algae TaxID=3058037 RepID=A0ABT8TGI5_9GAMM|nr:aminopeptidase N [Gilvimarinus sp. SDUM040014]MDO3382508.1 aminopeptidase N [Gilvimarinus sp. SDUM040014]